MSDQPGNDSEKEAPLRSIHTSNLPDILQQLGISLLVTTYQAGKLVVVRADGGVANTHFRNFPKPMGLAVAGDRLAIGTATAIREFHNHPAVAAKLEPPGKHDACFLPRIAHATGDIQVHEMAWAASGPGSQQSGAGSQKSRARSRKSKAKSQQPGGGTRNSWSEEAAAGEQGLELWFVNTRFSCLCTRSDTFSFVPRWRPSFISAYAPEDRCHLNGLGLRDGQVRYVTALGETDAAEGWRANKKDGGLLLDVPTGEVVVRRLSMPHSPRWYQEQLWLLESGSGGFGRVDLKKGRYENIASLPGFTRGLDFAGPLAFIGLSQVRESAVFSGIAIAELPLALRACGVWAVDVASGKEVAFLKFEDAVQEIFAVQVVPRRFPDLLNEDDRYLADSFVLPDAALAEVAESYRPPPNRPASR